MEMVDINIQHQKESNYLFFYPIVCILLCLLFHLNFNPYDLIGRVFVFRNPGISPLIVKAVVSSCMTN